jgi:methionyl aminopeptidase
MSIGSERDLAGLRAAGRVVADALAEMREAVRPGVTTRELDEVGAEVFARHGARSAPQLVYGFPGTTCISVNEEAVHGIPSRRTLRDGDLVTLDATAELDGYMADAAITVAAGAAPPGAQALCDAADRALGRALRVVRDGVRVNAVGRVIQAEVEEAGFSVIPALSGHGIGQTIHEPPTVANYFDAYDTTVLTEGLVLTIEPVIAAGGGDVVLRDDGWTVATADRSLVAHAEHTLVVTRGEPLVLTA